MTDAPYIKQNANGVYFLEGEQLWDSDILPVCLEHIKEGDAVIDAGAWIGGHTMAYRQKVGSTGKVWAFEPNETAYQCLKCNVETFPNVECRAVALGDDWRSVGLCIKEGWKDSTYVVEGDTTDRVARVQMLPLDTYELAPNFIKIDVEGCELKVLNGAVKTIEKHRPIMVIELNRPALERQGDTIQEVSAWLIMRRYYHDAIEANPDLNCFNILCTPR